MWSDISKVMRSGNERKKYSVLIPSWNNLAFLQLCIRSLREHSTYEHQLIVLVNEGTDGTLDWIREQKEIDYLHAPRNIGICYGLNSCRSLAKTSFLLYLNDDMYVLPGWDRALEEVRTGIGHARYLLSATMIEPVDTGNVCVIVSDYGEDLSSFQEDALLMGYNQIAKPDWSGSTWPPVLLPLESWDAVGGMSIEFHPGMYSDPDLSAKLWKAGVRYFRGVGASRVYHFGSKSTRRIRRNDGRRQFLDKWGMTPGFFMNKFLRRGQPFQGELDDYRMSVRERMLMKMKKHFAGL